MIYCQGCKVLPILGCGTNIWCGGRCKVLTLCRAPERRACKRRQGFCKERFRYHVLGIGRTLRLTTFSRRTSIHVFFIFLSSSQYFMIRYVILFTMRGCGRGVRYVRYVRSCGFAR